MLIKNEYPENATFHVRDAKVVAVIVLFNTPSLYESTFDFVLQDV